MQTYPVHEFAPLFQEIPTASFAALCDDIKRHGLRIPIVLYNDHVLDRRQRYAACLNAGVAPTIQDFTGSDEDPISYACSGSLTHWHLSDSHRVPIAADVADRLAALRNAHGPQKTREKSSADEFRNNAQEVPMRRRRPPSTAAEAEHKAAELMRVSREPLRTLRKAVKTRREAARRGEMSARRTVRTTALSFDLLTAVERAEQKGRNTDCESEYHCRNAQWSVDL